MSKQKGSTAASERRGIEQLAHRVTRKAEPCVGIFWLVDDQLLIEMTPLRAAEPYGNCLTHPSSHIGVWQRYQQSGRVPVDMDYEEQPRGRVIYDRVAEAFTVLADQCILKRKAWIERIKKTLRLPKDLTVRTDPHYKCFRCLGRTVDR